MQRYKILYTPFYFITIFSLTLLLLLAACILSSFLASGTMMKSFKEKVNLIVEIPEGWESDKIGSLRSGLEKEEGVLDGSVKYISREAALETMKKELGDAFLGEGMENPFSEVIQFNMTAESLTHEKIQEIQKNLQKSFEIGPIVYPTDLFAGVQRMLLKMVIAGSVLLLFLLILIVMLIHQIMRMNIVSNRFVIRTMELVGAKPGFIRKPFISEALKMGLIASVFCILIFTLLLYLSRDAISILGLEVFSLPYWIVISTITILSVVICSVSSRMAVSRYLNRHLDALYA